MSRLRTEGIVYARYAQKVQSMLSHLQRKRLYGTSYCQWSMSKIPEVLEV